MENKRYIVDERSRIAAVVDTFYPWESNCLDSYAPNCIKATPITDTNEELRESELIELYELAEKMNKENTVTREEVTELFLQLNQFQVKLKQIFPKIYRISID